jgi:hypothetical protein
MEFLLDFPQPVAGDVRVDFRRAVVRVTGKFLDHAKIRAVFQQMRSKAVPQPVRRHFPLHAGAPDTIFDVLPQRHRRKLRATPGQNTFAGDSSVTRFGRSNSM